MEDEDPLSVVAVEDATRRLDDLPVSRPPQFGNAAAALRMPRQLLDVRDHAPEQLRRSDAILERDVVRDRFEVRERRRLRPDYFSNFARRTLASAWLTPRPSASAISPRAIPSSTLIRRCIDS